jgi:5-methyltetrahydrofolate--homocysteine methyltransferase
MVPWVSMRLAERTLLDGGTGTELIARGLVPGEDCPELWNRTRAGDVREVAAAYFAAGARAVHTNTFGGNRVRLAQFGLGADLRALVVAGCLLAREVRPTGALVIGDLGPTGLIPPPEGDADLGLLEDSFAEQAVALAEGGVDLLHIETLYHPKEARAALRGARQGAPGLSVLASMTCRFTGTYATPLGYSPDAMLATFAEEGAAAVGVNCTLAPHAMLDLVRALRDKTKLPIVAQPTAAPTGGQPVTPDEMAAGALALLAAGATAVGGCCGSGPAHIAAIRRALDVSPRSMTDLGL